MENKLYYKKNVHSHGNWQRENLTKFHRTQEPNKQQWVLNRLSKMHWGVNWTDKKALYKTSNQH